MGEERCVKQRYGFVGQPISFDLFMVYLSPIAAGVWFCLDLELSEDLDGGLEY